MTPLTLLLAQDAVMVVSPDGLVVEADRAAEQLFDGCRGRLLGEFTLTSADVVMELLQSFRRSTTPMPGRLQFLTKDGPQHLHVRGRRRDRESTDVEISVRLAEDRFSELTRALRRTNDEIQRRIDVEEQLRRVWSETVVKLERSNADLRQLAETLAHDLRNPITTIDGFVSLVLADPDLDEGHRRQLERVARAATGMRDILEGVLREAMARSEADLSDVPLADLLGWVRQLVDDAVVRLVVVQPVPTVHVEVQAVRQLFLNLVSNAGKHRGRQSAATVTVTAIEVDGACEVTVADDGPGIPEALLEAVFERGMSTEDEGVHGLGLAMCRRIVQEHGGEIRAEASPSGGAQFRFTLPLAR